MTTVIGVSFKRAGKMYYFDPNGLELHIGDQVVVETARGVRHVDLLDDGVWNFAGELGAQGLNGLQRAAAGGNQILDNDHFLARQKLSFDLIRASVILGRAPDVAHRNAHNVRRYRRVRYPGGRRAHERLGPGIVFLHRLGDGFFHLIAR